DRLRRLKKDPRAGLPPDLHPDPTHKVQVFPNADDDGMPEKYRSHPTDYMREQNAKRIYIRSHQDDRLPWILFGRAAAQLRTRATERFYRYGLERSEPYKPQPAAEVQQFIDAEHAESTFDAKYHGLFDERLINPGDVRDLPGSPWPREQTAAFFSN